MICSTENRFLGIWLLEFGLPGLRDKGAVYNR
jgi:hypothetical protein